MAASPNAAGSAGSYTRIWPEGGRVWSQGAVFLGVSDSGSFGEILLMIALMIAFQDRDDGPLLGVGPSCGVDLRVYQESSLWVTYE